MKPFHFAKENRNSYENFNPNDLIFGYKCLFYWKGFALFYLYLLIFLSIFCKKYHILTQNINSRKKNNILSLKLVKFAPNILINLFFKIKEI